MHNSHSVTRPRACTLLLTSILLLAPGLAFATPDVAERFPLSEARRCATCHFDESGGSEANARLTAFGVQIQSRLPASYDYYAGELELPDDLVFWDAAIGDDDPDRDGYSSAEELGDLNYDGRVDRMDWPARSPGISEGDDGADMNECALGFDDCGTGFACVDQVSTVRPSFRCECDSDRCIECDPGFEGVDGVCVRECPATQERVDGRCMTRCEPGFFRGSDLRCRLRYRLPLARDLPDGVWTEIDRVDPHDQVVATACLNDGSYEGPVQLFEVPWDCSGGVVEVESDVPETILYASSRPYGDEVRCEGKTTVYPLEIMRGQFVHALDAPPGARVRARCLPLMSAPDARPVLPENAPVCSAPLRVTDTSEFERYSIEHRRARAGYRGEFLSSHIDPCAADLSHDVWFDYEASCTGRLQVRLQELCGYDRARSIAFYAGGECPERDSPLVCAREPSVDYPDCLVEPDFRASLAVRMGEQIRVRVSGTSTHPWLHTRNLGFECIPGPVCDDSSCVAGAACTADESGTSCACPDGLIGDGIDPARGGTGCVVDETPCLERRLCIPDMGCRDEPLECDPLATCTFRLESDLEWEYRLKIDEPTGNDRERARVPLCGCPDGFEGPGSGASGCVPIDDCVGVMCPTHSVCVDEVDGYRCECTTGFWDYPESTSDEVDCRIVCGDGERAPGEICDDGNNRPGDGCDERCMVEWNFACFGGPSVPSRCENTCGDGLTQDNEDPECETGGGGGGGGGCSAGGTRGATFGWSFCVLLILLGIRRRF